MVKFDSLSSLSYEECGNGRKNNKWETYWERTEKSYPKLAKNNYIFVGNISISQIDDHKYIKKVKDFYLGNRNIKPPIGYVIITKIIIAKGLSAMHNNGYVDNKRIPLFGKFKKVI